MALHGLPAPTALSQASEARPASEVPTVVDSVTTEPVRPLTCGSAVCSGPRAVPCATTGMPAAIALRAQAMSGGPDTALSTKASYFCDAMASLQLLISRWTSLLESKIVTLALFAAAVFLL